MVKTLPWDIVDHMETPQDMAEYLELAFEGDDAVHVAATLGHIARAKGMPEVAQNLNRSNPSLSEFLQMVRMLGLQLQVVPDQEAKEGNGRQTKQKGLS